MSAFTAPLSHLIRIDQPGRPPLFVKHMHRNGVVTVTFEPARAGRFLQQDPAPLRQASETAASWAEAAAAAAAYVPEGL